LFVEYNLHGRLHRVAGSCDCLLERLGRPVAQLSARLEKLGPGAAGEAGIVQSPEGWLDRQLLNGWLADPIEAKVHAYTVDLARDAPSLTDAIERPAQRGDNEGIV
jgi:hypothetical protein